ncbi:outer membrane protein [Salegentibacter salinarum]|nr:TolC family protein [Salegentibacter salinarum]SKB49986.1 outer membrane protein [Salegentibacter salinarum]
MKWYLTICVLVSNLVAMGQQDLEWIQKTMTEAPPQKKIWSLEECLEYARTRNLTVLNAHLDKSSAEVNYRQSELERLPNLSANASESFTNGYSIDPITSAYVNEQIFATSANLNSEIVVFNGFQLNNEIKKSKLLVDQNSFFVQEAENNISLNITNAYLQALYYREEIYVTENTLDNSEIALDIATARFEAGAIAKKDYSDALSQAASDRYLLIEARNNYNSQILILKQLLELGPETNFSIEEPDTNYNGVTIIDNKLNIYERALESLPEIKAGELNIAINEKELDIAQGGYLPSLSLSGNLGTGYTSVQDIGFYDQLNLNFNPRVSLSLNVPIFSRGQNRAQEQNARIDIEKARINLKSTEKEVYEKVETAWRNAIAAQNQIIAAEAARDAASDSYQLAQKQYEVGSINTMDLLVSKNSYSNAEQNYIQAKYLSILYSQLLQFYQGNKIKI